MSEPNQAKPTYRWPWFVLAAVVVAIILFLVWVSIAAIQVRERRDRIEPVPSTQPSNQ